MKDFIYEMVWAVIGSILLFAAIWGGLDVYRIKQVQKHFINGGSYTRTFVLIGKKPPTHFYVDLQDVTTGEVIRNRRVSTSCYSHNTTAVVGNTYSVTIFRRIDDRSDKVIYEDWKLAETFCQ